LECYVAPLPTEKLCQLMMALRLDCTMSALFALGASTLAEPAATDAPDGRIAEALRTDGARQSEGEDQATRRNG
jgi:hypothetical protein